MRRSAALLLILLLTVFPFSARAAALNGTIDAAVYDYAAGRFGSIEALPVVTLELNGAPLVGEMPAVIVRGRTLAPLRLLAEAVGAQVEWTADGRVEVRHKGKTICLTPGSAQAAVDDALRPLPGGVPAALISWGGQNYTMVPLRFFSEVLGYRVDWVQEDYSVRVSVLAVPIHPERYLIALDPGHGGSASGAFYGGTAEKDLNLAITLKVDELLRGMGYRTLLTRSADADVGLKERSVVANRAKADIFVSVHCNAAVNAPGFQGLYVYHYPGSVSGAKLAQAIQNPACALTGAVDRGTASANFSVVRESKMPSVLVETGFMSCPSELSRLKEDTYQTRLAQGIAQGIVGYLNSLG